MQPPGSREIEPVTSQVHVEPDLDAVVDALERTRQQGCLLSPEQAWDNAVSGNTAARMAGVGGLDDYMGWDETAVIIAKAAAYGWWPARTQHGYVAMPIAEWVAIGHPYTRTVPNLDAMLDRWGIAPVVIDAETDEHRNALQRSKGHHA